jgi:hypothetical protein
MRLFEQAIFDTLQRQRKLNANGKAECVISPWWLLLFEPKLHGVSKESRLLFLADRSSQGQL